VRVCVCVFFFLLILLVICADSSRVRCGLFFAGSWEEIHAHSFSFPFTTAIILETIESTETNPFHAVVYQNMVP
jgi:hypothetical protein